MTARRARAYCPACARAHDLDAAELPAPGGQRPGIVYRCRAMGLVFTRAGKDAARKDGSG